MRDRRLLAVVIAALVLFPRKGRSVDAGVRREGDFAYTADEGQQCALLLKMAHDEQRDVDAARAAALPLGDREKMAQGLRTGFISCVERIRQRQQMAMKEAQASAERTRLAQAEEQKKAAEMKARQDQEAALTSTAQTLADTPKVAQGILSALLCNALSDRAATMAELAKDRKYSRIGGAVNLSRRAEMQDELAATDDSIARLRASLRDVKRPALGCKLPAVSRLASCFGDDPDDRDAECSTPAGELMVRAARLLAPQ